MDIEKKFNTTSQEAVNRQLQKDAAAELDRLLELPENSFLTQIQRNQDEIFNTPTAVEALAVATQKIEQRLERTFKFQLMRPVEGVDQMTVNHIGIKEVIDNIKANQTLIGEGEDAFVVIDKNEIKEFPPEVCYKFSKKETTARGRNSTSQEADIHSRFYDVSLQLSTSKIGVPMPFYATEIAGDQMIAMEKLPAKSVDDILRSKGRLPEWLDIDAFCEELTNFLKSLHEHNLFHRDMHTGNIMISQSLEPSDKWGYVIDFGLSGSGIDGMEPYRKEEAGKIFTYNDDCAIIKSVKIELNRLRDRQKRGV